MGSSIEASCPCGYESDLMVGGGFLDFGTVCLAPALSRRRKAVVERDYYKDPPPMSWAKDLTWYNDPVLRGSEAYSDDPVFSWSVSDTKPGFELPDSNYRCPACGKLTLRFRISPVMWD